MKGEQKISLEDNKMAVQFEKDVVDFFQGTIHGNLGPYIYGAPQSEADPVRGGILYNEMLEHEKEYYLYNYEAALFQSKGTEIASYLGKNTTFIELGPGSEKSLRLKTLRLLRACSELKGYIGVDISQTFLDKSLAVIRAALPHIRIEGTQQDFTKLESIPDCENPVIFFKGSTIGNFTKEAVPPFIAQMKRLMNKKHLLLLVQDCNQDEISLMKAYDTKGMALLMENIMYRIKRDLNIAAMDAAAFRYQPEWNALTHHLKHVLTATCSQQFKIKGQEISIQEGQKFHTLSSYKYPATLFQEMVRAGGYELVHDFLDDSGRLAVHLFKG